MFFCSTPLETVLHLALLIHLPMKSYRRTHTVRINAAWSSKMSQVHFKKEKLKETASLAFTTCSHLPWPLDFPILVLLPWSNRYNRNKVFLTGSENHRIIHAGRGTGGLWSNLLLKQGQVWDQNSFLRTLSGQVLKTCKDRDSTTSRVKLLRSSTFLMGNKFLLVSSLDHHCSTYTLCLSPSHQ